MDRLSFREEIVAALVEVVGDGEDVIVATVYFHALWGRTAFLVASRDRLKDI